MPATSRAQQRFFYAVKNYQSGHGHGSGKVRSAAKSMSPTSVEHFTHTHGKVLDKAPKHKKASDALIKIAVAKLVRTKAASLAAEVATVLAIADPRFTKVAQDVRAHGDLHRSVSKAFPSYSKTAHDRIFMLVLRGATNVMRAKAADAASGSTMSGSDMMGMGAPGMGDMAGGDMNMGSGGMGGAAMPPAAPMDTLSMGMAGGAGTGTGGMGMPPSVQQPYSWAGSPGSAPAGMGA